jgi:hypothetical protein
LSAANAHTNQYKNINANPNEYTDAHSDSDADAHEHTNPYHYTNVYENIYGDTHINQHRDARARALGQLHRDYDRVSSYLCPQQCG